MKIKLFSVKNRRDVKRVFLHLIHPRFIRRMLRRIGELESYNKETLVIVEQNSEVIRLEKEKLSKYRTSLDKLRSLEAQQQVQPDTLNQEQKDLIRQVRADANDLAFDIIQREESIAKLEKAVSQVNERARRIRNLRRSYLRLVVFFDLYLIGVAYVIFASIRRTGIIPHLLTLAVSGGPFARGAGVVCVLLSGGGLYLLRRHWRRMYAALEFVFAGATITTAMSDSDILSSFGKQLSLLGGVYLVVRSLDNFSQGNDVANKLHKRRMRIFTRRAMHDNLEKADEPQ